MTRLASLILSICFVCFSPPSLWAQSPFDNPFDGDTSSDQPTANDRSRQNLESSNKARAAVMAEEKKELERRRKLSLKEQVETLEIDLRIHKQERDEMEDGLRKRIGVLSEENDAYKRKHHQAEDSLEEYRETLAKKDELVRYQSSIVHQLLTSKFKSEQEADVIEGLEILSNLGELDSLPLERFGNALAELAKSNSSVVRDKTMSVIAAHAPDFAIKIGYQSSKDFWLPVEAAKRQAANRNHARWALTQPIDLYFYETRLEEIAWIIDDYFKVPIKFDPKIDVDQTVDLEVKDIISGDALELMLDERDLAYSIKDSVILIVPKGKEAKSTLTYRVDALLREDRTAQELIELAKKVLGDDQPDKIATVKKNCLIVVADEKRQRKFSAVLAKINAAN